MTTTDKPTPEIFEARSDDDPDMVLRILEDEQGDIWLSMCGSKTSYGSFRACTSQGGGKNLELRKALSAFINPRPSELRQAGVDGEHPLGQGYVDALADTETADKIDDVLRYAKNAPKGDLYRAEYNKGWNDCLYFVADKMNAQPAAQKTPVDRQNQANLRDKEICTPQTISKATEGELIRCWELIKNTAVDEYDPISKNSGLLFKNHKTGNFAFISEPDLQAMEAALASRASVDVQPVMYARDLDGTGSLHACSKGDVGAIALCQVPPNGLSDDALETMKGMVEFCINKGYCMGMDEGYNENGEYHPFVKELLAFSQDPAKFPDLIKESQ